MDILLASGNTHKQREFQEMLEPHRILIPNDINVEFEYEETGTTFLDNSLGKALHLYSIVGAPVIADDSGLVVPALGGDPGVRSARYGETPGSPVLSDSDRYTLLLERMSAITDRNASFVCCLVMCIDSLRYFAVQERFDGVITQSPAGAGGFGYDPVFYVKSEQTTAAELTSERKNALSHRGKALARMRRLLSQLEVEK